MSPRHGKFHACRARDRSIGWRSGSRSRSLRSCAANRSAVPCDVPFQSLGFDSLRAVELQERLSQMSGVALSITTLWNYTSIDAYAAFLLDAMQGSEPASHSRGTDPLDGFSDDEIAAMLARELNMSAPESRT